VWDASTGEMLDVLEGHTELVRSVAVSGDGRRIVSGSSDKSIRVWGTSMGEVASRSADESVVLHAYIREKTMDSTGLHTLDGFSLRLEKAISCLYHLMHCYLTMLMPRSRVSYVDFAGASLGSQWHYCYRSL